MNFAQHLAATFPIRPEAELHPHCPSERAHLYHAIDGGSGELEVLNFLNALVYLFKPENLLETGSGQGFTAIAIADAIRANGFGHLNTVELDPGVVSNATANLLSYDQTLSPLVTYNAADSRSFIAGWEGAPFDFVLFDSLIAFRHIEFQDLLERNLLTENAVCAFHDTSRTRGQTMGDFNPEMIAALDQASVGSQWLEFPYSRGMRVLKLA